MSYLLDKKTKRKKISQITVLIFAVLLLFYFRQGIRESLAYLAHQFFRPVWIVGNYAGARLGDIGSYFASKNSLYRENLNLKSELAAYEARTANYNSILSENIYLKETFGRKDEDIPLILSAILTKPNRSLYDSLIIDAGSGSGVTEGSLVLALGSVPIGRVAEVFPSSAKVVLFSTSGKKTSVVLRSVKSRAADTDSGPEEQESLFTETVGRGGGNFEIILPREFSPEKGDEASLPGLSPRVVGVVQEVISDPRDPFIKALLSGPVNIQDLQFVEIELR